jgi:hypothetical protein
MTSMTQTGFLLREACQLAYMSGRWVQTDRDGNNFITIVESALPGNGDYSGAVTSGQFGSCKVGVSKLMCAISRNVKHSHGQGKTTAGWLLLARCTLCW